MQKKPLRYFLGSCTSSPLTASLCQLIHSANPENLILGSAKGLVANQEGVRHLIDTSNVRTFQKILLDSDVIVYDLNTCDLKEAEFAIKTLKMMTN
jgi:adenylate kinase